MTWTRCAKLALLSLALLLLAAPGVRGEEEEAFDPSVPHLDVTVDDDGATLVRRHGKTDALDEEALGTFLGKLAAHNAEGWEGIGPIGISENPLVMHADAMSDAREVGKIYEAMAGAQIYRSAIGISEHVEKPLKGKQAPDLDDLPDGYLKIELPKDEGLSRAPAVPKEIVAIHSRWSEEDEGGNFVVAIGARGRIPVENSWVTQPELESKDAERRDDVIKQVKKAAADYVAKTGGMAEILEINFDRGEDSKATPWALVDMAYRAALALNAEREKAGKDALDIRMAWSRQIAEPSPPEQPPEKPVEFPKDEPDEEDPTEDEKIVEDAKDEVNEDPSDTPNSDLAENPNDKPSDSESPHPKKEGTTSAVGLGGKNSDKESNEQSAFAKRRDREEVADSERIVAALNWLKDHQNREGYWSATEFDDDSARDGASHGGNLEFVKPGTSDADEGWKDSVDVGLTGLALMAFAGYGHDHKKGDYRATVRSGILYLRKLQDNDGCFGAKEEDHFVYNHAFATTALAEIYGLSGDPVLKPIVERAVEFILKAQNPGMGWRYGVQPGTNDSSVTGCMVQALVAAKAAGIEFDHAKAYDGAEEWFKHVTVDVMGYPKCGYDSPGGNNARLREAMEYENNPTMDAIYVKSMLAMDRAEMSDRTVRTLARGCAEKMTLPTWDHHKIDFYWWYYGSLAMQQVGGSLWETWSPAVRNTLLDHQRGWHRTDVKNKNTDEQKLDEHGSWDPVGAWGVAGGRVYSTAMGALILLTEHRDHHLPDPQQPEEQEKQD